MKVLIFGADWCPSCVAMRPVWEKLKAKNSWLKVQHHDFDSEQEMVERHKVVGFIPAFIFLNKDEEEILRLSGEQSEEKLQDLLNEYKDK